jgi:hypothetical protein
MGNTSDEQRALAHESRRVRSALDDLAELAGRNRRRPSAAPPARPAVLPALIAGLEPDTFPLPQQIVSHDLTVNPASPPAPTPEPAPVENDWFGDDDSLSFTGGSSSGEVDFNSAPDEGQDTLGLRAASTQEIPAPVADSPAPSGPVSEAINDVLDGFEW